MVTPMGQGALPIAIWRYVSLACQQNKLHYIIFLFLPKTPMYVSTVQSVLPPAPCEIKKSQAYYSWVGFEPTTLAILEQCLTN